MIDHLVLKERLFIFTFTLSLGLKNNKEKHADTVRMLSLYFYPRRSRKFGASWSILAIKAQLSFRAALVGSVLACFSKRLIRVNTK